MTTKRSEWEARVAEWEASGKTAADFAADKGYAPATLKWWASRLRREAAASKTPRVAMAKVERRPSHVVATSISVRVDIDGARIEVARGFDEELLRDVVRALRAAR